MTKRTEVSENAKLEAFKKRIAELEKILYVEVRSNGRIEPALRMLTMAKAAKMAGVSVRTFRHWAFLAVVNPAVVVERNRKTDYIGVGDVIRILTVKLLGGWK